MSRAAVVRRLGFLTGAALAVIALAVTALALNPAPSQARAGSAPATAPVTAYGGLSQAERSVLLGMARDTWKFYGADVDPGTHLPLDNMTFAGGSATPTSYGRYTSAANIGVYLWSVVAARDLGLIASRGPSAWPRPR